MLYQHIPGEMKQLSQLATDRPAIRIHTAHLRQQATFFLRRAEPILYQPINRFPVYQPIDAGAAAAAVRGNVRCIATDQRLGFQHTAPYRFQIANIVVRVLLLHQQSASERTFAHQDTGSRLSITARCLAAGKIWTSFVCTTHYTALAATVVYIHCATVTGSCEQEAMKHSTSIRQISAPIVHKMWGTLRSTVAKQKERRITLSKTFWPVSALGAPNLLSSWMRSNDWPVAPVDSKHPVLEPL